jgi:hypothetical protein
MKKNKLLILLGIIIIGLGSFFIYNNSTQGEDSFNKVDLKNVNSVVNSSLPSYYDTIVSVGLELAGIEGITVTIYELSDQAKQSFNGELNAHVRYLDGQFYLFIDPMSKKRAITIISHEIVHMKQYLDGTFQYSDGKITWNNEPYLLEDINYDDRPWETEAFQLEGQLASQISEVVYQ